MTSSVIPGFLLLPENVIYLIIYLCCVSSFRMPGFTLVATQWKRYGSISHSHIFLKGKQRTIDVLGFVLCKIILIKSALLVRTYLNILFQHLYDPCLLMFISPQLDQEVSLLNSIKISRKTAYPFFFIYFMELKGKENYQIHALMSVLL